MSVAAPSLIGMDTTHHTIGYIELAADDLAASRAFYEAAFGWEFNDYGPDLRRHPLRLGRRRGRRPQPARRRAGRGPGAAGLRRRRRVAGAVEAAGGRVVDAPSSPTRAAVGSRSPTRPATCSGSSSATESGPQAAARPRASRRRPTRGARPAQRRQRLPAARRLGGRRGTAVVGEGQLGDGQGRAGARAARSTHRPGIPAGASRSGRVREVNNSSAELGPPARDVERRERVGGLERRRRAAAVGLPDVGQLAARGRVRPPGDGSPRPSRHQGKTGSTQTTASPASSAAPFNSPVRPARAGHPRRAGRAPARRTGARSASEQRPRAGPRAEPR